MDLLQFLQTINRTSFKQLQFMPPVPFFDARSTSLYELHVGIPHSTSNSGAQVLSASIHLLAQLPALSLALQSTIQPGPYRSKRSIGRLWLTMPSTRPIGRMHKEAHIYHGLSDQKATWVTPTQIQHLGISCLLWCWSKPSHLASSVKSFVFS